MPTCTRHLACVGAFPRPTGGCFLRAEAMHALFDRSDRARARAGDQAFNELSHGQSFLRYVADRPIGAGLWILDEPEAALSFQSCLALLGVLSDLVAEGSQVIMATHSPLLAACTGADIWELTDTGIEARTLGRTGRRALLAGVSRRSAAVSALPVSRTIGRSLR